MPGALKSCAKTLEFDRVGLLVRASFGSRKSFRTGPGVRYMHHVRL